MSYNTDAGQIPDFMTFIDGEQASSQPFYKNSQHDPKSWDEVSEMSRSQADAPSYPESFALSPAPTSYHPEARALSPTIDEYPEEHALSPVSQAFPTGLRAGDIPGFPPSVSTPAQEEPCSFMPTLNSGFDPEMRFMEYNNALWTAPEFAGWETAPTLSMGDHSFGGPFPSSTKFELAPASFRKHWVEDIDVASRTPLRVSSDRDTLGQTTPNPSLDFTPLTTSDMTDWQSQNAASSSFYGSAFPSGSYQPHGPY